MYIPSTDMLSVEPSYHLFHRETIQEKEGHSNCFFLSAFRIPTSAFPKIYTIMRTEQWMLLNFRFACLTKFASALIFASCKKLFEVVEEQYAKSGGCQMAAVILKMITADIRYYFRTIRYNESILNADAAKLLTLIEPSANRVLHFLLRSYTHSVNLIPYRHTLVLRWGTE